ncbi:hypothetical protein [Morganella morganii]|nr:hypothetical protein [Morganella morganii]
MRTAVLTAASEHAWLSIAGIIPVGVRRLLMTTTAYFFHSAEIT